MHWRSIHVSLAALALCGAIGAARAADTDLITEKPVAKAGAARMAKAEIPRSGTPAPDDATTAKASADMAALVVSVQTGGLNSLRPVDWTPEHAPRGTDAVPASAGPNAASATDPDKAIDPEPDVPVSAPTTHESHDPLDHPKAVPSPAGSAAQGAPKPGATTTDAAKADPTKADAGKADLSKPALVPGPSGNPTAAAGPTTASDLPALNRAIKAALDRREATEIKGQHAAERRKEREAIAFYYAAHGFAPTWSQDGKAVAALSPVLARLARAGEDALTLADVPKDLRTSGSATEIAESDVAVTEAVVAYARQATGSRVDPFAISRLIGARPDLADPAEVLDSLVAAGVAAGDRLQALNPVDPRYVGLRDKLAELRAAHVATTLKPIPPGPTLKIGMRDPRVPLIRSRFSLGAGTEGDADDLRYDTVVAAAVADFQRANGLPASGTLTKRTIAALSGGEPSRLEATIVANMEMWRWMPRELGQDRIEVNVPDYVVTVFHDGAPVSTNRVVVGKTTTPTPLFSNTMKFLIVNPVWNVPDSIIKKEFLPKAEGDPSYLAAHGYTVSYHNGRLVVKQPAGARNALGRIKFMFPNDYSVYLHDTPSKSLFSASRRAFSHGCVRVDQPFAFAESVLNTSEASDTPKWSQKRLERMLGNSERYVNLPKPLPIHIEYFTASVDDGQLKLREDIYDYTRRVTTALAPEG